MQSSAFTSLDLGALLHVGFLIRLELLDGFISARLSGCLAHMQVFLYSSVEVFMMYTYTI